MRQNRYNSNANQRQVTSYKVQLGGYNSCSHRTKLRVDTGSSTTTRMGKENGEFKQKQYQNRISELYLLPWENLTSRCLSPPRSSRAETIPIQPTRRRWRAAIAGLNIIPASPLCHACREPRPKRWPWPAGGSGKWTLRYSTVVWLNLSSLGTSIKL